MTLRKFILWQRAEHRIFFSRLEFSSPIFFFFFIAESFIPPFPAWISSILICRMEVRILICSVEVAGDFIILILKCIALSFCLDLRKRTTQKGPLPTRMLHKEFAVIAALMFPWEQKLLSSLPNILWMNKSRTHFLVESTRRTGLLWKGPCTALLKM